MAALSLVILIPTAKDFDMARDYVAHFGTRLRAPDALHLAVARSNNATVVATLDGGMLAAAKKLKIPAKRLGNPIEIFYDYSAPILYLIPPPCGDCTTFSSNVGSSRR